MSKDLTYANGGKPCVVLIDDERAVRHSLHYVLRDRFDALIAEGPLEGWFYLSDRNVDIVLLDIRLRDTNGLNLLRDIKQQHPFIEVIMITAYASLETIQKAIRYGAYDYLIKPFDKDELLSVMAGALSRRKDRLGLKTEIDWLTESALYMERMIGNARDTVIASYENMITAMLTNIDSRDGYTWAHARRVSSFSSRIAGAMGFASDDIGLLSSSAFLHDIGKVRIDGTILSKEYSLSDDEYAAMKKHPENGAEIISRLPLFKPAVPLVMHHHEWYDGSGYPSGLRGERIPLMARVLSVADTIDSMLYSPRRALRCSRQEIESELRKCAGSQFDPGVVEAVISGDLLSLA